jgi:hypothetical protein
MAKRDRNKLSISDTELSVAYKDINGQIVELRLNTLDISAFEVSLPDFSTNNNPVKVEFESIEELEEIIKDFKTKFNYLKQH